MRISIAAFATVLVLATAPPARAVLWSLEKVDSLATVGEYTSISIDATRRPHISYYRRSSHELKYAVRTGHTWSIETVDDLGDVGQYTSLALAPNGMPRIAYLDADNQYIKYAYKSGATWTIDNVAASEVPPGGVWPSGTRLSLALDPAGEPHISFADQRVVGTTSLLHAQKLDVFWSTETVPITLYGGQFSSIAVDQLGRPHISYLNYYPELSFINLGYAVKTEGTWTIETPDPTFGSGGWTSIALDADDHPHIAYHNGSTSSFGLYHAFRSSGGWIAEPIDTTAGCCGPTSLAIDDQGTPHVAYAVGFELRHARKQAGNWIIETVDDGIDWVALAAHPGMLGMSYYDRNQADLRYAETTSVPFPNATPLSIAALALLLAAAGAMFHRWRTA